MATDYVLFIHGVNTRDERENPTYAKELITQLEHVVTRNINLKPIPLFWGDVNKDPEDDLRKQLMDQNGCWDKLWFKDFRQKQLLQFSGDAALYISRSIGTKVVDRLKKDAERGLAGYQEGDRLHLVTHSWGTVILFDALFAARWDESNLPEYDGARRIRKFIFGVEPNPRGGIPLASIHTMGSPIALFSLISVTQRNSPDGVVVNTHDLTQQLQELLENLYTRRGRKLPWRNFIHPGDPVAWPLEKVIPMLVDGDSQYLDIKDVVTHKADLSDFLFEPASQTALALVHGGDAHGSYFTSMEVAQEIAQTIQAQAEKAG
jgi:hypothetical protein